MSETIVAKDKIISVTYVLRDQKGEVFELSDLPISYLHGSGSDLFEKIESAMAGHKVGDKVQVELAPADGFGDHNPELIFSDDIDNIPEELRHIGMQFEAKNAKGEAMMFTVTDINGNTLTVDANHPLAGQTVQFEVEIKEIRDASTEELANGQPSSSYGGAGMLQ